MQPRTDHGPAQGTPEFPGPRPHERSDRLEVFDGAEPEAPGKVRAVHGDLRPEGTGRQHERVVGVGAPCSRPHRVSRRVDPQNPVVADQPNPVVAEHASLELDLLRTDTREHAYQRRAVVRARSFVTDNGHPHRRIGIAEQLFDEPMGCDTCSDDQDLARRGCRAVHRAPVDRKTVVLVTIGASCFPEVTSNVSSVELSAHRTVTTRHRGRRPHPRCSGVLG